MPDLPGASYIAPAGPFEFRGPPAPRNAFRAAYDTATAARLWRICEELTHIGYHPPSPAVRD